MRIRPFIAVPICLLLASPAFGQGQGIVTGIQTQSGPSGTTTTTTVATGAAAANTEASATTAEIGAATAAIPGSGIAASTTPGSSAGYEEGSLLVASATKVAAQYITQKAITASDVLVLLGGGSAAPDISAWLFFKNQTARILSNMRMHEEALNNLLHPAPLPKKGEYRAALAFAPIAALALLPKVLSYAYTAYQTAGQSLTVDDYMMDVALLQYGARKRWSLYSQQMITTLPSDISKAMDDLDTEAGKASGLILQGQAKYGALSNGTKSEIAKNAGAAAEMQAAVTALGNDLTAYSTFLNGLDTSANGVTWSAVLQAYAIDQALQKGGVAYIKVHSAGLGVMTESNLWTNLGAPPMFTSVGMVVSYVFYPQQTLEKPGSPGPDAPFVSAPLNAPTAGIFEVRTAYHTMGKVASELRLDSAGTCNLTPVGPDANQYCPVLYGDFHSMAAGTQ